MQRFNEINIGRVLAVLLFALLLAGLFQLAVRESKKTTTLREIVLRANYLNNQPVEIEGYVRNYYDGISVRNRSFSFASGNYTIAVKSGIIKVPPKGTLVKIKGIYHTKRSNPYVVEHIALKYIEIPKPKIWFMRLDDNSRYQR